MHHFEHRALQSMGGGEFLIQLIMTPRHQSHNWANKKCWNADGSSHQKAKGPEQLVLHCEYRSIKVRKIIFQGWFNFAPNFFVPMYLICVMTLSSYSLSSYFLFYPLHTLLASLCMMVCVTTKLISLPGQIYYLITCNDYVF